MIIFPGVLKEIVEAWQYGCSFCGDCGTCIYGGKKKKLLCTEAMRILQDLIKKKELKVNDDKLNG